MKQKISNPVVFLPGMFVGATDFYETWAKLPIFAANYCDTFVIHKRESGINITNRASALYGDISRYERFHLLCHSLGGLDARMCLYKTPELQKRCLSLTTIATPHQGTPLADLFFSAPKDKKILTYLLQNLLHLDPKGQDIVHECTYEFMDELNKKIGFPETPMYSMPYLVDKAWKMPYLDKVSYAYLCKQGITLSDGVVPLPSQLFGETIGDQVLGNIAVNYGSHLAQTAAIRYGLPWQTIWAKTFIKYFDYIWKLENK